MKKNKNKFRYITGLVIALLLGSLTYIGVAASPSPQEGNPPVLDDLDGECNYCHPAISAEWESSAHGLAVADPAFLAEWSNRGEPQECLLCHTTGYDPETNTWEEDGIACQACHFPISGNHPLDPMPSNRSADLCEDCHSQTVTDWQLSVHHELGLGCVDCHGQHSTTLKEEETSILCANCHQERASNFTHSVHSEQNLTCVDCHLEIASGDTSNGDAHVGQDHSFRPKLETCNECHASQMHDSSDEIVNSNLDSMNDPDAEMDVQSLGISVEPDPVNPIYFALISALIGMVGGLLVAPWIQEWYQKSKFSFQINKNDDSGEDEK